MQPLNIHVWIRIKYSHKFHTTLCVLQWWNCTKTRESNKSPYEWCQDRDHNPFWVYILQLRVLKKVSSAFTGGGWNWIESNATGVKRARGRANHPDLPATPTMWAPLTVFGHLFFHFCVCFFSQLLLGSCLICKQMHVHTGTKKAICCEMTHWSNNSGVTSSNCVWVSWKNHSY